MEPGITVEQRLIDGPVRLEVNEQLVLPLTIFLIYQPTENDQSIIGCSIVQFQPLLCGNESILDRLPILTVLNIGSFSVLFVDHFTHVGDLLFRGEDERHHTGAGPFGVVQFFDESFDFELLHVFPLFFL